MTPAGPGPAPADRPPILLDCDPGVDDALALLTALRHTRLVAVTTVAGNVGVDHTTRNALRVLELCGAAVPVHRGADRPRAADPLDAAHVHGADGLAGADLPEPTTPVDPVPAARALVEATRRVAGLHVVAIGPLTNLAAAIDLDPDWPRRVAGVTVMGGAVRGGNATAAAEFNMVADPEAAEVVFDATPVTMIGLDVTNRVRVADADLDALAARRTSTAVFATAVLRAYLARYRDQAEPSAALHDPCAVLAVCRPDLFDLRSRSVAIETAGAHTRGATVVDERPAAGTGRHLVGYGCDAPSVLGLVLDALADPEPSPD